jgi:hypothetical protein
LSLNARIMVHGNNNCQIKEISFGKGKEMRIHASLANAMSLICVKIFIKLIYYETENEYHNVKLVEKKR